MAPTMFVECGQTDKNPDRIRLYHSHTLEKIHATTIRILRLGKRWKSVR